MVLVIWCCVDRSVSFALLADGGVLVGGATLVVLGLTCSASCAISFWL